MNTRRQGSIHCEHAFTRLELLVVIAVLAVLASLVLAWSTLIGPKTRRIHCVSQLAQIGLSFRLAGTDHGNRFPWDIGTDHIRTANSIAINTVTLVFQNLSNELGTPRILSCPADTRRPAATFQTLTTNNISYFIRSDPNAMDRQTPLAGDRNLTTNDVPVGGGLVNLTTNLTLGWTAAMHNRQGNMVLRDGCVRQFTTPRLAQFWWMSAATNCRIVVP